jgi:hypothetical protein
VFLQCCTSALVLMRIRTQLFTLKRIRIQGAKTNVDSDPDPDLFLSSLKVEFDMKSILYVANMS